MFKFVIILQFFSSRKMLPTYQRVGPTKQRSFKSREKILIFLIFASFCFVVFCGFFFLPDNFGTERVLQAYSKFKKNSPEIFIPGKMSSKWSLIFNETLIGISCFQLLQFNRRTGTLTTTSKSCRRRLKVN